MAEHASLVPSQPDKENAAQELKLYFRNSDQLQQRPYFHALQAPSSQESLAHAPTLSSSAVHDPCLPSQASACSSDCHEAYHRHIHQHPYNHLYHQYAYTNYQVLPQLFNERQAYAKLKAEIIAHPLFENLLQAHAECLSVGVSSHHMQALKTQLAKRDSIIMKYLLVQRQNGDDQSAASMNPRGSRQEIDAFMENYLQLLLSWKNYLEELVIPPTIEALSTLCEIEHAFCDLTGVLSHEISNGSMTRDEEWEETCFGSELHVMDELEAQSNIDQLFFEHLRMELKKELKDSYRETIQSMREEIIRKRQVGKLPGNISPLKKWCNAHSKWPYPSEQEKRKLVQETGLEMRQINNWFINHRKRHWPSHHRHPAPPSSNAASAGSSSLLLG